MQRARTREREENERTLEFGGRTHALRNGVVAMLVAGSAFALVASKSFRPATFAADYR